MDRDRQRGSYAAGIYILVLSGDSKEDHASKMACIWKCPRVLRDLISGQEPASGHTVSFGIYKRTYEREHDILLYTDTCSGQKISRIR